ncbi:hypothetical protein ACJX0J_015420, partial [Zea mays]
EVHLERFLQDITLLVPYTAFYFYLILHDIYIILEFFASFHNYPQFLYGQKLYVTYIPMGGRHASEDEQVSELYFLYFLLFCIIFGVTENHILLYNMRDVKEKNRYTRFA